MAKSTRTTAPSVVSTAMVREAFQTGALDVADVKDAKGNPVNPISVLGRDGDRSRIRGRVNPAFVAHYEAANPGTTFREKSNADEPRVTLPVTKTSASGATLKRPVDVPVSEFRRLSGQAKGRPGAENLTKAAAAYMSERGIS